MSRFLAKGGGNAGGVGVGWGCERLVSNWLSCASVYGQSDTSAVGFTQFAGCQMRLIVLPSAGHSFFSSASGGGNKRSSEQTPEMRAEQQGDGPLLRII